MFNEFKDGQWDRKVTNREIEQNQGESSFVPAVHQDWTGSSPVRLVHLSENIQKLSFNLGNNTHTLSLNDGVLTS